MKPHNRNGVTGVCVATRRGGKWMLRVQLEGWVVDDILTEIASTGSFLVNTVDQSEQLTEKCIELHQALPLLTPPYP